MIYIDWIISAVLAFIMLAVGLSLRLKDFQSLASNPAKLLLGMGLQLVLLPLIAFAVATAWNLPPAFQVGIIILAATPGGMTSNFISYLFNANTALAVSLTISNSLVTMFTVPLLVNLGLNFFYGDLTLYSLPFAQTAGRIFGIVLAPVLLGVAFRGWQPKAAARLQLGFRWLSMLLLGVVFTIKVFAPPEAGGSALTSQEIWLILPASLLVNVLALITGRFFSWLFGYSPNEQLTMGVEIGIQNTSLAFLIAGTVLGNQDMLKPALIYATFSFTTAVLYGLWVKPNEYQNLKREFLILRRRFGRLLN